MSPLDRLYDDTLRVPLVHDTHTLGHTPAHELFQGPFSINSEEQCFFTHRVKSTLCGQTIPVLFMLKVSCYKRRRQWHPTPVLLPGKSHGWWSL